MKPKIKEVIFFCYGDSAKASTWSNVPYLFTRTLEARGIRVRRVRLPRRGLIGWFCDLFIRTIYSLLYPQHVYKYIRTPLYRKQAFRTIRRAVSRYAGADLCIFACFDFWNPFNDIPSLLFSDWTYEIFIRERMNRAPYPFEERYIRWQAQAVNAAETVVSLFPECAATMKATWPDARIFHLGNNVVNNLCDREPVAEEIIPRKRQSKRILFVGNAKYAEGCRLLLDAFDRLLRLDPEYRLDVVGMKADRFSDRTIPPQVTFHGYLNKDDRRQRECYYRLLFDASLFVNPTMIWGGYSSTIEAMFFYTPVIVAPYKDFVTEFGDNPSFGLYNREFNADCLLANMKRILTEESYEFRCLEAHRRTEDHTWDNYVEKILETARLAPRKTPQQADR